MAEILADRDPLGLGLVVPRKVARAYARAVHERRSGNFTVHLREGRPMAVRFEDVETLTDVDRGDVLALQ